MRQRQDITRRCGHLLIAVLLSGLSVGHGADVTPSCALVFVAHDTPGIYRGEVRATDLNGDGKPDLVLHGAIGSFNELWGLTEDGKAAAWVRVYLNRSWRPGDIRFARGVSGRLEEALLGNAAEPQGRQKVDSPRSPHAHPEAAL